MSSKYVGLRSYLLIYECLDLLPIVCRLWSDNIDVIYIYGLKILIQSIKKCAVLYRKKHGQNIKGRFMLCNEEKSRFLLFFTLWPFLAKLNCILFSTIRETCINTILSSRETSSGVSAAVPDPVKIRLLFKLFAFFVKV